MNSLLKLYRLIVLFHAQLALHNLVYFFEHGLVRHGLEFLLPSLDNVVHAIEVLVQSLLVLDHRQVAFLHHLPVFPRHVQILLLIDLKKLDGGLLEANHVLNNVLTSAAVKVFGEYGVVHVDRRLARATC